MKDAGTGDTLASPKAPIILERIDIYEPVISRAIEPKTQAEREKLDFGLKKMADEVFGMLLAGRIRSEPSRTYGLAEAAEAHRALESRRTTGATVLLP